MATPSANIETRVPLIFGFLLAFTPLMLLFIAGRLYTRVILIGRWGLEDWLIMGACFFSVAETVMGCLDTRFGAGYHIQDFKPEWTIPYAKIGFASGILFSTCISLPKLSLCVTYLRLFPSKISRMFCKSAIVYIVCFVISTTAAQLFACRPIATSFNPTTLEKKCISLRAYFLASGILNCLSDFLVFLFPVKMLWDLQLPTKQKWGVIAVFSSGCIVCIAGIIRLWYIQVVFTSEDFAYAGGMVWVSTCIEVNVGIICGCLHAVKPLLSSLFPCVFGASSGSNAHTYSSKHRGRIADRTFPFQNLDSKGRAVSASQVGSAQKSLGDKPLYNSVGEVAVERPGSDYNKSSNHSPRVHAWAVGGTDTNVEVPAHGIAYSHHVTVKSTANQRVTCANPESKERSQAVVGASVVRKSRNKEHDAESQEWIMNT